MTRTRRDVHDKPVHRIYDSEGREVGYEQMRDGIASADVLLFGEIHGNPVAHRLEFEITKDLCRILHGKITLGAEMFEADTQLVIDEYLAGLITSDHFRRDARAWDNYVRDYQPLVEFAREHGLTFVATNIPRRYASLVVREGLGALRRLPREAARFVAPPPVEADVSQPDYGEVAAMSAAHGRDPELFVVAQAVKDATMAHFISTRRVPGSLFIHYHGVLHSRDFGGIYWYLKGISPLLAVVTVTCAESETSDFSDDHRGSGDYVVVIPGSMT
ncbi:MAG TPA: ChaN family lipoprotein [Dissulfurispiraceae bacterium]|nr:ChaN family lipoprotein [Dissulfurispiraceae bacterium]